MSDSGTTPKGPRGSIGPETYDAVKKLIDAGMNKTEAFAQVAKETGRSAATVTTTYYRIAKRKPGGGGVRTSAKSAKAATRKAVGGQTDRLAGPEDMDVHSAHKPPGLYPHKGHAIPVFGVHVGLNLEDEAGEIGIIRLALLARAGAGAWARRKVHHRLHEGLDTKIIHG
jgi:hypothetical protein